jgi:hypothetical protein
MSNAINSYWMEDYRIISENEVRYDYEIFPRFLYDEKQPNTSEIIEVSNILSSIPRQYYVGILKKSDTEQDVYQTVTSYRVWLFPETSLKVRLTFAEDKIPVGSVWINRQEYLFIGFPDNLLFIMSGKFPVKSFGYKLDISREKIMLMTSMAGKLPRLEQFLKDLKKLAGERIEYYGAHPIFIDYLQRFEISPQINESSWDYYTRLFNLLTSLHYNLTKNNLINLQESSEIISFITSTLLEGRIFD